MSDEPSHIDNSSVDMFAHAMKAKLARKRREGRGGWDKPEECRVERLETMLREHFERGLSEPQNLVDIANFCMMLHCRKMWELVGGIHWPEEYRRV